VTWTSIAEVTTNLKLACTVVALLVPLAASAQARPETASFTVASITDGDTLRLTSGARVRLLQIDTPELGTGECYSRAARTALLNRVPVGSRVVLEVDSRLDRVDRYGRLLRYVHRGTMNVNVALVRAGAAAPYFFDGERGKHAARLLAEAVRAKAAKRGLWGACRGSVLDPNRAVDTGAGSSTRPRGIVGGGCDPGYAGGCVPHYPPDLDCADIRARGIPTPVRVVGPDPHGLDGDGDRLGCER
jgi:endonuclease YncB( thermonuclease family)